MASLMKMLTPADLNDPQAWNRKPDVLMLAREAGFKEVLHVPATDLARRYFADRTDGLRPPANAEEFLVATT